MVTVSTLLIQKRLKAHFFLCGRASENRGKPLQQADGAEEEHFSRQWLMLVDTSKNSPIITDYYSYIIGHYVLIDLKYW